MNQEKVNEILVNQEQKYKAICDSFEIGQHVELMSNSYDPDLPYGAEGKVIDKGCTVYGCDLRVDFEGYETWIDAEDVC